MQMDDRQRYSQWESGEGYNRYVTAELMSFRKAAWKRQILRHFDARDGIKVLDVGTGPGFFACILSEEAHFRKYGTREIVTGDSPEFLATCPMTRYQRPEWDERVLMNLGMAVEIQRNIGRFVYGDWEKELYAESSLFEICARKG